VHVRAVTVAVVACAAAVVGAAIAGTAQEETPGTTPSAPAQRFHSRPDLRPPVITVDTAERDAAPGYVFVAPKQVVAQAGPLIFDDAGQVVWFDPLDTRAVADFRVQRYHGRPVLTWWQGQAPGGVGSGRYVILDGRYRLLGTVTAAHGLTGDIHEFILTPRNTALFTIYRRVPRDLSSVGGPKQGAIEEGVVQELDPATGRVLFEWHSADHVGLDESYAPPPPADAGAGATPYDYFHINSVDVDHDGNFIVSARNTHTVYKIARSDGHVIWRLGGKHSDFRLGRNAAFAWQHDARRLPDGTLSLFDNEADPPVGKQSRAIVLQLDEQRHRATLVHEYLHPKALLSGSQGNAQLLPNGHFFVGWGANPYVTEFTRDGKVVFDAHWHEGSDSYRGYRFRWTGRPIDRPALAVELTGDRRIAYASWNGATAVASWRVLAGADTAHLEPVATARRRGFETAIPLETNAYYVAVAALAVDGTVLGRSRPVGGAPSAQPAT
jgi:hypothetical protein